MLLKSAVIFIAKQKEFLIHVLILSIFPSQIMRLQLMLSNNPIILFPGYSQLNLSLQAPVYGHLSYYELIRWITDNLEVLLYMYFQS